MSLKKKKDIYNGFEQGPIRPPSEAGSLLIRLTRNCPWNMCFFCPVYKKKNFSFRAVENIIKDIDILNLYVQEIRKLISESGKYPEREVLNRLYKDLEIQDRQAFNAVTTWISCGMESIFLQDANSLVMKPEDLIFVLKHIRKCFPWVKRTTSYASSHSIVRVSAANMKSISDAGLNRIHIGMESGSDNVLKRMKKGATKEMHIKAGLKVKEAGMELSEYIMPGLGGIELSIEHALETSSALNSINPDFIRFRTLAVSGNTPLGDECVKGNFQKPDDIMMAKELRLLLESLDGIDSYVKSDHILNLFETLEGKMPEDKDKMIGIIDKFFSLAPEKRIEYQIGRRMGFFRGPDEMDSSPHLEKIRQVCKLYSITEDNVDSFIDEFMQRFV